eukprot:scaffold143804_cov35-Attheya_sp.AAC.1
MPSRLATPLLSLVAVAVVPTGADAVACSVSPIQSVIMTKCLPCPDRRPTTTIDSLLLPSFRPVLMLWLVPSRRSDQ